MQTGNNEDQVTQIKKRLIHAQVMFERAERASGGVADYLHTQGVPPDICKKIREQDLHAVQLSHERTRCLLLFEIAMLTGTADDFRTFVDTFLGNKKTA